MKKNPTRDEVFQLAGSLLGTVEYLRDERKLLVDVAVEGAPMVCTRSKEMIIEKLLEARDMLKRLADIQSCKQ